MTVDEDDFGGADLGPPATPQLGAVIPFPNMRPNAKLRDAWAAAVARASTKAERTFRFNDPIDAAQDLERRRQLPRLPWPQSWPELGKRARLYVGESAGVTGPTGGGKTSFALQVAIAAAAEGHPVLWNPLELSEAEIDVRLVANMTGTHTARINDEWSIRQITHALSAVADMWHYVPRELDVDRQIESYRVAIAIAKEVYGKPPLLVIDYIQKLGRFERDPRLAVANAAERIRAMTEELESYTLVLSQPSRSNNALLTGKVEIESATDAVGAAGESAEIEHACAVIINLNVFKRDDADELDAHVLVSKARGTGREGREGFKFQKPGGVWRELDYLPATPGEIANAEKKAKKDKTRVEPPTKQNLRSELNLERAQDAAAERRRRVMSALARAGMGGMSTKELRKVPGAGKAQNLERTLQELEREGAIERLISVKKWRIVPRG